MNTTRFQAGVASARTLIEHRDFDRAGVALSHANAIALGLDTAPAIVARFGGWLHAVDQTVIGVFVDQLFLRFFVYLGRIFHDPLRGR